MSSGALRRRTCRPRPYLHQESRARANSDSIRVGVIGYGYWGPNIVRNLSALDRCEVVSVCDRNAKALKRAQKSYPGVHLTTDFTEVLESPDIDAVAIVTPVWTHFDLAKAGARKRQARLRREAVHVDVGAGDRAHRAGGAGRTCGSWSTTRSCSAAPFGRFASSSTTARSGQLYYFDSTRVNLGLFQHDVSVVWDLAPHDLSIMDYIIREQPEAVVGHRQAITSTTWPTWRTSPCSFQETSRPTSTSTGCRRSRFARR